MLSCRNPDHGKSIVKRWKENEDWFAIQRCRKCDVWERIKIEAFQDHIVPVIKREIIEESA